MPADPNCETSIMVMFTPAQLAALVRACERIENVSEIEREVIEKLLGMLTGTL